MQQFNFMIQQFHSVYINKLRTCDNSLVVAKFQNLKNGVFARFIRNSYSQDSFLACYTHLGINPLGWLGYQIQNPGDPVWYKIIQILFSKLQDPSINPQLAQSCYRILQSRHCRKCNHYTANNQFLCKGHLTGLMSIRRYSEVYDIELYIWSFL